MNRKRPSITSLVAFVLILALPMLYVLSYAPVVSTCSRTTVVPAFPHDASVPDPRNPDERRTVPVIVAYGRISLADASLYPAYKPIDWLIDNTPLREPLFTWAGFCGVRTEFERAQFVREFGPQLISTSD